MFKALSGSRKFSKAGQTVTKIHSEGLLNLKEDSAYGAGGF
jgi:hypothetical protein